MILQKGMSSPIQSPFKPQKVYTYVLPGLGIAVEILYARDERKDWNGKPGPQGNPLKQKIKNLGWVKSGNTFLKRKIHFQFACEI
jgi:hypothetical protein